MPLVERDGLIAWMHALVADADNGRGVLIVVSGDAGAGKTVLVKHAIDSAAWGYCEPLSTPRPLGPFRDIGAQLWPTDGDGADALNLAERLLLRLREPGPALVVEDAHWIDTASADVLRFLGRRIVRTSGVVIVTMRDGEGRSGTLQSVLGDLASVDGMVRITVPPLTGPAVRELVHGTGLNADKVLRLTGGNAFYVTQLVATPGQRLAVPVRDSVMARLGRLPAAARAVVELLAVIPGRVSSALIVDDWDDVDEAVNVGLLQVGNSTVEFRHELVRLAVESELAPGRRSSLHAEVLRRMIAIGGAEPSMVAHHARESHNRPMALAGDKAAAERASALSSHHEAAAHYRHAVEDARSIATQSEQVQLLLELARVESAIAHDVEAREAARRGVQLSTELDDPILRSAAMRTLSPLTPSEEDSHQLARAAVQQSEPLGASTELAAAYANLATNRMIARDLSEAIAVARQAIALAQQVGDVRSEVVAANALGSSLLLAGDRNGLPPLRRAIHLAAANGFETELGRAYANLVSASGEARLYSLSESAHNEALSYFVARDLDGHAGYTRAWHARCLFEQGHWHEAAGEIDSLLAGPDKITTNARLITFYLQARIRARRGEAAVTTALDSAQPIAQTTGALQRTVPVAAAQAEAHWLAAEPVDLEPLEEMYRLALTRSNRWMVGELGFWLWRFGRLEALDPIAADPYRLHTGGDHEGAATAWMELGCPYEAADAWCDSADQDSVRRSLEIFTDLGANPARRRAARRLRALGVRSIPRGPRHATRQHPYGLTAREHEVLQWVRSGDTDSEIAARLHLSARTVGHHVSAILRKTDVPSRRDLRER